MITVTNVRVVCTVNIGSYIMYVSVEFWKNYLIPLLKTLSQKCIRRIMKKTNSEMKIPFSKRRM